MSGAKEKTPFDDSQQNHGSTPFDDGDKNRAESKQTHHTNNPSNPNTDVKNQPKKTVGNSSTHKPKVRVTGLTQSKADSIFKKQRENPDDVIFFEDFKHFRLEKGSTFRKLVLYILLAAPAVAQFFIANLFEDFMLSQFIYQIGLVVCLQVFEKFMKVDYDIILINDLRFVKKQVSFHPLNTFLSYSKPFSGLRACFNPFLAM